MIRWKYVVPRLLVFVAIALSLTFGLNPLLRLGMILTTESLVGSECDVGSVTVSVCSTDMRIDEIAVANPQAPMSNLFQLNRAHLNLNAHALLKKKLVVDAGAISGLQFGRSRDESGALSDDTTAPATIEQNDEFLFPAKLTQNLVMALQADVEQNLKSVPLAHELKQRWPMEIAKLETQVKEFWARIQETQQLVESISSEPIEAVRRIPEIKKRVQQFRDDRRVLHDDLGRILSQTHVDRDSVAAARRNDAQFIREKLKFSPIGSGKIAHHTLGTEWTKYLRTTFGWIHWTRQHLPRKMPQTEPSRGRGVNVMFPVIGQLPDLLVRELEIDGIWNFAGHDIPFKGVVRDLTNQPGLYGQPLVVSLRADDELAMTVDVVLDHAHDPPVDQLDIECPAMRLPSRSLGNDDQFRLSIHEGIASVMLKISLAGDELSGTATIQREDLSLDVSCASSLNATGLGSRLEEAVKSIRSMWTTLTMEGSVQRPRVTIKSSLPTDLASVMNSAIRQVCEDHREKLLFELEAKVDGELSEATKVFDQRRTALLDRLQVGEETVQQISQDLLSFMPSTTILGRSLPWQNTRTR